MKITWTVVIALISFEIANAQTYTWTGTNSSDWNTGSNWVNNAVPGSTGANANVASFTTTTGSTTPNLSASETVKELTFLAGAPAYTLTTTAGQTLTLDGDTSSASATVILDSSTATETINGAVIITDSLSTAYNTNLSIVSGGNLVFGTSSSLTFTAESPSMASTSYGNMSIDGAFILNTTGVTTLPTFLWNPTAGILYYDPTSQSVSGAYLRSVGAGVIELQTAFAGTEIEITGNGGSNVSAAGGEVYLDANGLNSTTQVLMNGQKGGSLATPYIGTYTFGANASGTASMTQSGAISISVGSYNEDTDYFDVAANNTLTVSGKISGTTSATGTLAVNKISAGTLILSNSANSFGTATTTVVAGKLLITGTTSTGGAITVDSGAALGGAGGTINATGVTVASGGGLSVSGGGAVTAGTMTLALTGGTNTLDISATAGTGTGELTFVLGTAHDELKLTSGTLVIGNGLLSLADFTITNGSGFGAGTYVLFDGNTSGITGSLAANGLSGTVDGYAVTLNEGLDTSGNADIDLIVAAVPEPGSLALLFFGGAALLLMGWRQRRLQGLRI